MAALNEIQVEILKLFKHRQSEKELLEIKDLLTNYLAEKVVAEADKSFTQKKRTVKVIEKWRKEHVRRRNGK